MAIYFYEQWSIAPLVYDEINFHQCEPQLPDHREQFVVHVGEQKSRFHAITDIHQLQYSYLLLHPPLPVLQGFHGPNSAEEATTSVE